MDPSRRSFSGQFLVPVLFVDGHTKMHDVTRSLTDNPQYPYEPTKDWIWYKPKDGAPSE